jgi:ferredoxin
MECGACALNCPAGALKVDAGVGCAAAIIYSWITGKEPTCGCETDSDDADGANGANGVNGAGAKKTGGCCR